MNKKWIIIGGIIIVILVLVSAIVINSNQLFNKSTIDLSLEDLDVVESVNIKESVDREISVDFTQIESLTEQLTVSEVDDFQERLKELFTSDFLEWAAIKSDFSNYYNNNIEELQTKLKFDSEEDFVSLVHKLSRNNDYSRCRIVFNHESIEVIDSQYLMTINVVYDEEREIEYYMMLDLNNLQLKIK